MGEYFVEVWKSAGMQMQNVQFLWASEEIGKDPETYWNLVMNIAKANSISRCAGCTDTSSVACLSRGSCRPFLLFFFLFLVFSFSFILFLHFWFVFRRIKRCSQIMGRTEGDDQPAAQILYPCMQVRLGVSVHPKRCTRCCPASCCCFCLAAEINYYHYYH